MTHCTVLRCSSEAETGFNPLPGNETPALPVCGAHHRALTHGVPWLLDGDMGVPGESGPTVAGVTIRMGADFPATVHQTSLMRTTGHAPGVRISLMYGSHEGPGSTEFWMTEDQGRILGEFFKPPPPIHPASERL